MFAAHGILYMCMLYILLAAARAAAAVHIPDGTRSRDPFLELKRGQGPKSAICHHGDWRKKSVKLISEMPAVGLFRDIKGYRKFEASGITHYKGQFAIVFDSLQELGFIDRALTFYSSDNHLVGEAGEESDYEAITHRSRTDTLLAVVEGRFHDHHKDWHPVVREIMIQGTEMDILRECIIDYHLPEGDKKGFEGAEYVDAGAKGEFLMGLCEGNFCEGPQGRGTEAGNGRIVLTKLQEAADVEGGPNCVWETQRVINVPPAAAFRDYSDIDLHGDKGIVRVGITSQEDAAIWVGWMDLDKFEFVGEGEVLHFPRTLSDCLEMYCNIEGLQWIDETRFMTATDRAKKRQPWHCSPKDQSVQLFALPLNKHLLPPQQATPA